VSHEVVSLDVVAGPAWDYSSNPTPFRCHQGATTTYALSKSNFRDANVAIDEFEPRRRCRSGSCVDAGSYKREVAEKMMAL